MAFVPIPENPLLPGKPVTTDILAAIRSNFSNLDSRVTSVEGGGNVVYPPILLRLNGNYASIPLYEQTLLTTINFSLTLTGVFLICENAGSSGDTEIDVQYKRGVGSWTSVFNTKPKVNYADGALAISSNGVLNFSLVNLLAGDYLRLLLTAKQGGTPRGLLVRIDFNKT